MTRRALLFATLLPLISLWAAYGDEPRLLGTWKANRKATEWYLTTELNLKPDVAETLGKLSGRVTIVYTPTKATFRGGDFAGTYDYEILQSTGNEVEIQYIAPGGLRSPVTTIIFSGPKEFWSVPRKSPVRGFRENFRKVD